MRKKLRLLVATDFSAASQRALRAAAVFAAKTGAEVTVVHVRPPSDIQAAVHEDRPELVRMDSQRLRRRLAKDYRRRLDAAARRIPGARTLLRKGWPASAIAATAAVGYDLIVAGSRGRSAMRMALLGSTTQEILRRSRVPVLVVETPSRPKR